MTGGSKLGLSLGDGFTIIEVMIVLLVTMAMFASAVLLINGKQGVATFRQAIYSIQTEMQQTANEVSSGYYLNTGKIECVSNGGNLELRTPAGSIQQGTNEACLFLGKAFQFAVGGSSTDPQEYNVYTVVGLRGTMINPTTDLASAKARVIAQSSTETSSGTSSVPSNQFENKRLQYGLTVSQKYWSDPTRRDTTAFTSVGIISRLAGTSGADISQQVDIVPIRGSSLYQSRGDGVGTINGALGTAVANPSGGVNICFNSGGSEQSGLISLGGGGRQDLVSLKIFNALDCGV